MFRDAATREERCNIPKKYFLKIGYAPDSELTAKNRETCLESEHPSVLICDTEPDNEHARGTHRKVTNKLKMIKKRFKSAKTNRVGKNGKINRKQRRKGKKKKLWKNKGKRKGNRKRKKNLGKSKAKAKRKKMLKKRKKRKKMTG